AHRGDPGAGGGHLFHHPSGGDRPELSAGQPQFQHKTARLRGSNRSIRWAASIAGTPSDWNRSRLPRGAGGHRGGRFGAGGLAIMRLLLRFVGLLFAAGTIVFVVGIGAAAGLLWHYSKDLPDYSQLQDYEPAVMT